MINLTPTSDQEAFDMAVRGILKQGCAGAYSGGCMYLSDNGNSCGVGQMFSPEELAKLNIHNDEAIYNLVHGGVVNINGINLELLCDIQEAHDSAFGESSDYGDIDFAFIEAFKHEMAEVASRYELNTDELEPVI